MRTKQLGTCFALLLTIVLTSACSDKDSHSSGGASPGPAKPKGEGPQLPGFEASPHIPIQAEKPIAMSPEFAQEAVRVINQRLAHGVYEGRLADGRSCVVDVRTMQKPGADLKVEMHVAATVAQAEARLWIRIQPHDEAAILGASDSGQRFNLEILEIAHSVMGASPVATVLSVRYNPEGVESIYLYNQLRMDNGLAAVDCRIQQFKPL